MIGKFIAKVKEFGISETKDKLPQVVANFICYPSEEDQKNGVKPFEKVGFFSLKGGAADITLKTLQILGYQFTVNDLSDIANGQGLDLSKEIELVIAEDNYNGKTTEKIKGVFEVGSSVFNAMKASEATTLMRNVDISGTVMNFMQSKGIKSNASNGSSRASTEKKTEEAHKKDIPW